MMLQGLTGEERYTEFAAVRRACPFPVFPLFRRQGDKETVLFLTPCLFEMSPKEQITEE